LFWKRKAEKFLKQDPHHEDTIYGIKTFCQIGILEDPVSSEKEGNSMHSPEHNDEGFTGLEAAIVLIAFVVVAAVFSYVVLGAGFFTTEKARQTVYQGVEQSTSNLMITGQILGLSDDNTSINNITFTIGLAPGASAIDLTSLKIHFFTPTTTPIILTQGTTLNTTVFTTTLNGIPVTALNPNEQVTISFPIANVSATNTMNIELQPSVGASLPFTKTAPAKITRTNKLL
jgi:flagellin FlaB